MPGFLKFKLVLASLFVSSLFSGLSLFAFASDALAQTNCTDKMYRVVTRCNADSVTQDCEGTAWLTERCYINNNGRCVASIPNQICGYKSGMCTVIYGDPERVEVSCDDPTGGGGGGGACDYTFQYDCRKPISAGGPGCNTGGWDGEASGADCRSQGKTCQSNEVCCQKRVCEDTATPTNPPITTTPPAAYCQNIRPYNATWAALSYTQLTQLKAGDKINLCATGYATGVSGSYVAARFSINGVMSPETRIKRPGTTGDFCYLYTIPTGKLNFSIAAEVLHSTLGWVK